MYRMKKINLAVVVSFTVHIHIAHAYAGCQLRRIWLDGGGVDCPWEFDLFSVN